jgi:glutamate/aspartate transport system permease protein
LGYNWNWGILLEQEPGGSGTWLQYLLVGLEWSLATALAAWVIALVVGSIVGTLRTTTNKWVVRLGDAYVEIFRNIPLIVQMFLWFFVFPEFLPKGLGDAIKQMPPPWSAFIPAVLCLGVFTSVRVAEQVRAGIQSLPKGQRYAGLAMGLSLAQTYRYVLLPMAYRIIIPPLTSESMNIIKNTSVAFAVSIAELTMFAMQAQEETSRGVEVYIAVTVLYFVSAFAVNRLAHFIEGRVQVPGMIGGK